MPNTRVSLPITAMPIMFATSMLTPLPVSTQIPGACSKRQGARERVMLFAVRLDTFEMEDQTAVFYIGSNDTSELGVDQAAYAGQLRVALDFRRGTQTLRAAVQRSLAANGRVGSEGPVSSAHPPCPLLLPSLPNCCIAPVHGETGEAD